MISKKLLALLPISLIALASCSGGTHHNESDYILELQYKENFKILQLSDIHLGNKDDRQKHFDFMDLTISDANPDFIICTGDLFTFADKTVARDFFSWLDGHEIPWSVTFGNHDEQCYFSIEWLTGYLNELNSIRLESSSSYCYFKDIQDDDIYGNANFVINLKDGSEVKEQIYVIDSNRYDYSGFKGYDHIKPDQIDWYKRMVDYSTENFGKEVAGVKEPVKSIAFFHIPVPEYEIAYDLYQSGDPSVTYVSGDNREGISCPKVNSGFFDAIVEKSSTTALFVGHDHVNNTVLKYQGVHLCYGINSTDRIYGDADRTGGLGITLKCDEDNSFELEQYQHYYSELDD